MKRPCEHVVKKHERRLHRTAYSQSFLYYVIFGNVALVRIVLVCCLIFRVSMVLNDVAKVMMHSASWWGLVQTIATACTIGFVSTILIACVASVPQALAALGVLDGATHESLDGGFGFAAVAGLSTFQFLTICVMVGLAAALTAIDVGLTRFNKRLGKVVGTSTDAVIEANHSVFDQSLAVAGVGDVKTEKLIVAHQQQQNQALRGSG